MIFVTWLVSHLTLGKDFIDLFYKQWRFPAEISIESLHIHANSPRACFRSASGHVRRLSCGRKRSLEKKATFSVFAWTLISCVEISFNCSRKRVYKSLHRLSGMFYTRWNWHDLQTHPPECRWEKNCESVSHCRILHAFNNRFCGRRSMMVFAIWKRLSIVKRWLQFVAELLLANN